jgi:asparagine synthase (glutamine-hydrolysing)
MCGIFGAWPAANPALLERCARRLTHRGPDGFGSYIDAEHGVFLALCRLAVIDLSDRGKQPMCNEDGSVWITFNGEIYNYREIRQQLIQLGHTFRSDTDTETIVHGYEEWGMGCLERLRGMFAFCIWDTKRQTLTLARDRLGIKPLYYCDQQDRIAFASEIKALMAVPWVERSVSFSGLCQFLQHGYVSGPQSIWNGVLQLPPGHYLNVNLARGTRELTRYWELSGETQHWEEDAAIARLEELLASSVSEHLISDVPVGVFLSGGLDSSTITSYAAPLSPRINTYSIGFEGWEGNELSAARKVADHYGTTHHEGIITRARFPELRNVYAAFEQPLADSSVLPTHLLSELARESSTVALSGDGGDELFGGYNWYEAVQPTPRKRMSWMAESARRALSLGKPWPYGCANQFEQFGLLTCPSFALAEITTLFPQLAGANAHPPDVDALFRPFTRPDLEPIKRWQNVDVNAFLVDDNLLRVDRCSMAHSLEVRVPLLDHRLAEFAFSLPDDLRIRRGEKKYLLKRVLQHKFPAGVLDRPKQGFSFPVDRFWPIDEMLDEVRNGTMRRTGFIDAGALDGILADRSQSNWRLKLWMLAVLERWASHWVLGDLSANKWHPASDPLLPVRT